MDLLAVQYWEKAEFPFHVIPKLASLKVAGGTIKVSVRWSSWLNLWKDKKDTYIICQQGYGCPGLSLTANAFAMAEVARVDASCSTFILVHSSLAMLTISNN